jgi:hypothetical protein
MHKFYIVLILALFNMGIQAQDFRFGKISIEEALEKAHPIDKEANAAVFYRSVSTYYDYNPQDGFTLVTDVFERIKIYKKEGFEWATRELSHYKSGNIREIISGLKGSTYNIIDGKLKDEKLKKDGIFEEDKTKYQIITKFTMPAVTEGSVIEYQYTLRSPFVTVIDDVLLQYRIPINQMDVKVTIPEFFGFMKHSNPRSSLHLTINESNKLFSRTFSSSQREAPSPYTISHSTAQNKIEYNQKTYSIINSDIPALQEESHIDYIDNYAAFIKWELQYTKFPNSTSENLAATWEGVSKSIFSDGGYEKELSRTNFFEKDLKQQLEGISSPKEKAMRIYEFVKSKVKWNDYIGYMAENGISKAYKDGVGNVGDINLLLIAMLRHSGLNAHPVLISTRNNGVPVFPTRRGFNYVISAVELPNEKLVLLDATDPYASFGELPARAQNWMGRVIKDKDNSDWVALMPNHQSRSKTAINIQFEKDHKIKGKSNSIINGLNAKSYREKYLNLNTDNYIGILEKNKGNIEITGVETENQKRIGEDIKESFVFELKDAVEVINDKMYLKPLLFMAEKENPFKSDVRKYPIIFEYPYVDNRTVNIMVPEGYEIEFLPESAIFKLNEQAGTFKFITFQKGNFIRIESELDFKNIIFTPLDYKALKDFYAHIVEKHAEAIVFKKI